MPPVRAPAVDQPLVSRWAELAPARKVSARRVVSASSTSAPPPTIGPDSVVSESPAAMAMPPLANAPTCRGPSDQGNSCASSASECRVKKLEQQTRAAAQPDVEHDPGGAREERADLDLRRHAGDPLEPEVEVAAAELDLERQPVRSSGARLPSPRPKSSSSFTVASTVAAASCGVSAPSATRGDAPRSSLRWIDCSGAISAYPSKRMPSLATSATPATTATATRTTARTTIASPPLPPPPPPPRRRGRFETTTAAAVRDASAAAAAGRRPAPAAAGWMSRAPARLGRRPVQRDLRRAAAPGVARGSPRAVGARRTCVNRPEPEPEPSMLMSIWPPMSSPSHSS